MGLRHTAFFATPPPPALPYIPSSKRRGRRKEEEPLYRGSLHGKKKYINKRMWKGPTIFGALTMGKHFAGTSQRWRFEKSQAMKDANVLLTQDDDWPTFRNWYVNHGQVNVEILNDPACKNQSNIQTTLVLNKSYCSQKRRTIWVIFSFNNSKSNIQSSSKIMRGFVTRFV